MWFQNRRTKAKRQVIEDRERSDQNQCLPSSKGMDSQHHSSLSDPNLSPPEQGDDGLYDDDDSDDIYPTDDGHDMKDQ